MKLTKPALDALACAPGRKDRIVFDDDITGFGVRVSMTAKIFVFQYRIGPKTEPHVRIRIGKYGDGLTLAQARDEAKTLAVQAREDQRAWRAKVRAGEDPRADRAARQAAALEAREERRRQVVADAFTLAELVTRWASHGLADRSARHKVEAPRALRSAFAAMLGRPAAAISPGEIQAVLDDLVVRTPVMARRVRDYGRAAFNWAARRRLGGVGINPFAVAVIEAREAPRDRVLSDVEIGEAWRAAVALSGRTSAFFGLLILTLQRRSEVAGMAWRELADDLSTWTIPAARAKNRTAHIVHLAEPARAILRALPRIEDGLVLGGLRGRQADATLVPASGFAHMKARLFTRIEAERAAAAPKVRAATRPVDWRLHDLRRTGVTTLARLGVGHHVADRILNHVHGSGAIAGVAAVYQRFEFLPEREAALRIWADHVLRVAGEIGTAPDNVVPLRRG